MSSTDGSSSTIGADAHVLPDEKARLKSFFNQEDVIPFLKRKLGTGAVSEDEKMVGVNDGNLCIRVDRNTGNLKIQNARRQDVSADPSHVMQVQQSIIKLIEEYP